MKNAVSKLLSLALIVTAPLAAHAKDLYLTVRRDFAPDENPVVEVNYKSADPITFRLLKPKDLKGFVASQIDLRRSWKEPKLEVNTANPFLRGLNGYTFSVDWLRGAVHAEMRRTLVDTMGGASYRENGSRFNPGPKKFISAPESFEVVKEFSMAPKEVDEEKPFDVPGFDEWSGYSLSTRMIELPQLDPGFYVLQTLQGGLEGQVVVVVNDIQASLHQTDGAAVVRATDRAGRPAAGAAISLRDLNGRWIGEKKADSHGVAEFKGIAANELIAVIEAKGTAIIDTEFFSTVAVAEDLYLYTDRPMYRPGDEVNFKGILREPKNGVSRLTNSKLAQIALVNAEGIASQPIYASITEFGTFSGTFDVPEESSGLFRVQATVDEKDHIGELRVKDYVKPLFFARLTSQQETARAGDTIRAKLKVERYAGGVPSGARYRVELYRSRLESPKWIDDAGLGESGSKVTYGFDQKAQVDVSIPELILSQDEKDLGRNGTADIAVKILSNQTADQRFDYKYVLKVSIVDDDGNSASASKSFLDMKAEILAQTRMNASFAGADFPAQLVARAVYPSGKAYQKTKGFIEWKHLPYKGQVTTLKRQEFETDGNGRFETKVPSDKPGQITATVTLFDRKGETAVNESSIIILPPTLGEGVIDVTDITVMTRKNVFAPGETSKALVLLPEGWGEGGSNKGRLYVTVAGNTIHETRAQDVNGLSAYVEQKIQGEYGTSVYLIISYSDPVRGWTERTVSYVIPPLEKILKVTLKPQYDLTLPGSEQAVTVKVADASGRPVKAEVSLSVVDRAVMDLQPEIRPSLIEFFYPPGRLNLMTFLSTQFQSYGYGETIARLFKANHWFASTKSPPSSDRLIEKDTAFWTAHVETDAKGEATSSFRLPANQTIWQVTAVVADTDGRFGEGTVEFKANSPVQTILAMPSFLRLGDQGQVRLTLLNLDSSKTHSVKYALTLPDGAKLDQPLSLDRHLKPGEQARDSRQIRIERLAESGRLKFDENVEFEGRKLAFAQDIRTLSNRTPSMEIVPLSPNVTVELKDDESVSRATVTVTTGLMGAVMPSLRWLVQYPHGCVEQITNQTIPNLVVANLFEGSRNVPPPEGAFARVGAFVGGVFGGIWEWVVSLVKGPTVQRKVTKRYQKLITDAATFGDAGLKKLAAYQNSNGSFSWFEESSSNADMTMFVLLSLLSTEQIQWTKAVAVEKAFNYLHWEYYSHTDTPQKAMLAYLSGRMRALKISERTSESYEPNLRQQANNALKSKSPLQIAFMLLALRDHEMKIEGELAEDVTKMISLLQDEVKAALGAGQAHEGPWRSVSDRWPQYVGRDASNFAIAAHALHTFGKVDEALEREVSRFLMKFFNGANFGSTFETGQVLAHSAWLLKKELESRDRSRSIGVKVNGTSLASSDFDVLTDITGLDIALKPTAFKSGTNKIELADADRYMSSSLRLVREVPMERAQDSSSGWMLKKSVFRVDEAARKLVPIQGSQIKVGDTLYIKIEFGRTEDRNRFQSSYYTLKDDIPAGTSVIEEDKDLLEIVQPLTASKLKPIRKIRAESIEWYYSLERGWMERPDEVGYFLRADFAGDYVTGVARIEDFYDEQSFAQTKADRLLIAPHSP